MRLPCSLWWEAGDAIDDLDTHLTIFIDCSLQLKNLSHPSPLFGQKVIQFGSGEEYREFLSDHALCRLCEQYTSLDNWEAVR